METTAAVFMKAIDEQLARLGLSTDEHPHSGIMSEAVSDLYLVKLYDDYFSGIYIAAHVADLLEAQESLDFEGFWDLIAPYEVYDEV